MKLIPKINLIETSQHARYADKNLIEVDPICLSKTRFETRLPLSPNP